MQHYILDGNNIIGKDRELKQLQQIEPQLSREKLIPLIDRYFAKKKVKVSLHFDGFQKDIVKSSKAKIIYSDNKTADEKIRDQIESSKNSKKLVVVTSDRSLFEFAKVCSCTVIKSEEFLNQIRDEKTGRSESEIQEEIHNDEIKKLFGV